jgi:hypothetical protein
MPVVAWFTLTEVTTGVVLGAEVLSAVDRGVESTHAETKRHKERMDLFIAENLQLQLNTRPATGKSLPAYRSTTALTLLLLLSGKQVALSAPLVACSVAVALLDAD